MRPTAVTLDRGGTGGRTRVRFTSLPKRSQGMSPFRLEGWKRTANDKERTVDARLDLLGDPVLSRTLKHLTAAGRAVEDSPLSPSTRELVLLRASQINGCGFCVDMHAKDAAHAGETADRLHLVAAWREATVFTDAERAALELVEEGTRIADAAGGVSDEVWENAAEHHGEDALAALVSTIAVINALNRLSVITRQPAGHYRPGMFG